MGEENEPPVLLGSQAGRRIGGLGGGINTGGELAVFRRPGAAHETLPLDEDHPGGSEGEQGAEIQVGESVLG